MATVSATTSPAAAPPPPQIVGKYEMGKVLAAGDFDCRTRLCTHIVTGAQYAVRIYDKRILAEASWMWNQTREAVQVMRTLPKHENIVEMVECFETQTSLYILMQLHSPTHITKMYTTQPDIPISKTKHYFTQVVRGLLHMHDNNVVHCGIAPDHILVNDRDQAKIGFLVSCKFYQKGKLITDLRGTKHTVAPEVLRQEPYNPTLADAWSLGVFLFFMLNGGQYPHDGANTTKNILNNKVRPLNPALPALAKDLVLQLMSFDPVNRLSVGDVFSHPWMLEDRAEEDIEFQQRSSGAMGRSSLVESNYDPNDEILSITLPFGLSTEEEAAYIIQHTWKAYLRRKRSVAIKRLGRAASLRLKRIAGGVRATSNMNRDEMTRRRSSFRSGSDVLGAGAATAAATAANRDRRSSSRGGGVVFHNGSLVPVTSPSSSNSASSSFKGSSILPSPRGTQQQAGAHRRADDENEEDETGQHCTNPHQCKHCGRLPPQRIQPGKSPYPNAKFSFDVEAGEFREVAPQQRADSQL